MRRPDAIRARAPRLDRHHRGTDRDRRLALTVFGIVRAPQEGWGAAETLLAIGGGVALLAAFVAIQASRRDPLMRLSILRTPNLAAANLAQLLLGAAWIPMLALASDTLSIAVMEVVDSTIMVAVPGAMGPA